MLSILHRAGPYKGFQLHCLELQIPIFPLLKAHIISTIGFTTFNGIALNQYQNRQCLYQNIDKRITDFWYWFIDKLFQHYVPDIISI